MSLAIHDSISLLLLPSRNGHAHESTRGFGLRAPQLAPTLGSNSFSLLVNVTGVQALLVPTLIMSNKLYFVASSGEEIVYLSERNSDERAEKPTIR